MIKQGPSRECSNKFCCKTILDVRNIGLARAMIHELPVVTFRSIVDTC